MTHRINIFEILRSKSKPIDNTYFDRFNRYHTVLNQTQVEIGN